MKNNTKERFGGYRGFNRRKMLEKLLRNKLKLVGKNLGLGLEYNLKKFQALRKFVV